MDSFLRGEGYHTQWIGMSRAQCFIGHTAHKFGVGREVGFYPQVVKMRWPRPNFLVQSCIGMYHRLDMVAYQHLYSLLRNAGAYCLCMEDRLLGMLHNHGPIIQDKWDSQSQLISDLPCITIATCRRQSDDYPGLLRGLHRCQCWSGNAALGIKQRSIYINHEHFDTRG